MQSGLKEYPVDVNKIAESFGLKIFQTNLREGISGALIKDRKYKTNSGFAIFVQKTEPYFRQRYVAAHLMGHFNLHKGLIGENFEENYLLRSDKTSNQQEEEANQFAARLLMPYALINKIMEEGPKTVEDLAEQLQVTDVAMSIRLGLFT